MAKSPVNRLPGAGTLASVLYVADNLAQYVRRVPAWPRHGYRVPWRTGCSRCPRRYSWCGSPGELLGASPRFQASVGHGSALVGREPAAEFLRADRRFVVVRIACRYAGALFETRIGQYRGRSAPVRRGFLFPLGRIGRRDEIVALRCPCHRCHSPPLLRRPNCTVVPGVKETTRSVTVLAHRS